MRFPFMTLLLLVVLFAAADAGACSCSGRGTPAGQFAEAQVTFVGEVIAVKDRFHTLKKLWTYTLLFFGRSPEPIDDYERRYGFELTFRVERMWRGPATKTIKVLTARGGGDCGYVFEAGRSYLVYAYDAGKGEWSTNICTRTREAGRAAEDLAYLKALPLLPLR